MSRMVHTQKHLRRAVLFESSSEVSSLMVIVYGRILLYRHVSRQKSFEFILFDFFGRNAMF